MKQSKHYAVWGRALGACSALLVAGIGLGAPVPTARAQTDSGEPAVDTTTLPEVLKVAIQQRPTLRQAAIDVDVAEASMLEALGINDWLFDASASWVSTRIENLAVESDIYTLESNLSRALSTGGTVLLHVDTKLQTGTRLGERFDIYEHNIWARLNQPLLRNRGKKMAYAQRRRAKLTRDAAALAHRVAAVATVREVVNAYWELAYAWSDLKIRQNSLALSHERLKNTQAGIDAGAVAPTEALTVEQDIVSRQQAILNARLSISQRSVTLRRLAGLELGRYAIDMQVAAPLTIAARTFDIDQLLKHALASSPTFARLAVLEDSAKLEVELTENGLLPELDLVLSAGPTGNADSPVKALSRMGTFEDLELTASLTYRRPVQQRTAKGAARRMREQMRRQVFTTADIRQQITAQLVLAVKQARTARTNFELGARAIDLAEKNVEAEKARFELGRTTNFQVLQRQDELQRAQLAQARSLIDFLNAVAQIEAITGDILETYGITLDS